MHGGDPAAGVPAARQVDAVLQWRDRHLRFVRTGSAADWAVDAYRTIDAQRETFLTHALPALWQARTFVHRV
jgi:hypothetical protein